MSRTEGGGDMNGKEVDGGGRVSLFRRLTGVIVGYLYPARCISCRRTAPMSGPASGSIMPSDAEDARRQCFCESCLENFRKSCNIVCVGCGHRFSVCECAPEALRASGVRRAYACFAYEKGRRDCAASRFIYSLKGTENSGAINLAACLLHDRIIESGVIGSVGSIGNIGSNVILTFVPRGRKNVRKYGGDHMKMTAKLTAERLGCEFIDAFENSSRGEQKKRGLYEREHDASESIWIRKGVRLSGRRVIVIDDLITRGASIGACVTLARDAGAADVAVFTLAKTRC